MIYHQITSEERYMISAYRKQGCRPAEIARRTGRHRSTICRELKRNYSPHDDAYRPSVADRKAHARRSHSRRRWRFTEAEISTVETLLRKQWSPEQIAGTLRRSGQVSISHETIYRYVWDDRDCGGVLYKELRQSPKKRRKRYNAYDSRGRLAGKRHISQRPAAIENRTRFGHWEIDTVIGAGPNDCIVTIVERKSGYVVIGKLKNRTSAELTRRVNHLISRCDARYRTITADNGTEFHGYRDIEAQSGVTFYFATPYHSWERGTNENTNGLIRQYLPKRTSMADVTQQQCNSIARKLNTRPRKRHDFRTPTEVLSGQR